MGTTPSNEQIDFDALFAELRDRVAKLQEEIKHLQQLKQPITSDAPMSKREVAKRLRVSRGRTLGPAIKRGLIRTVMVGNEERIPVAEFVRLRDEGFGGMEESKG